MSERAAEARVTAPPEPLPRARPGVHSLATQMGNAAFRLARTASPGAGLLHPQLGALLGRRRLLRTPAWSATEATAIRDTWARDGRYTVTRTGDVRQTHAYAVWKAGALKAIKPQPKAPSDEARAWIAAHETHEEWSVRGTGTEPAAAGALPAALAAVGQPPTPSMRPVSRYEVTLPGGATFAYRDDPVAPSYRYLTNETGVGRGGRRLSDRSDADAILTAAGITDATVRKVMTKVSTEEGGFEAVNTYDTGFISVGFIQFISGATGTGSLAAVLREMKTGDPTEFATYFHALGIDVDGGALSVVEPGTGNVLTGAAAVTAVMDDKRLTAAFQRAGTDSRAFQAAQVKRAFADYYLAPQTFTVQEGAVTISGRYEDVLTSDAGKTALMDRAVQKGAGGARSKFRDACKAAIAAHGVTTLAELARYEIEIIPTIQNRIAVLTQTDLTQPPAAPVAAPAPVP